MPRLREALEAAIAELLPPQAAAEAEVIYFDERTGDVQLSVPGEPCRSCGSPVPLGCGMCRACRDNGGVCPPPTFRLPPL